MKFLIIQTAFVGDVVLATPLIEKIHRFFPGAEIDFLLRKGNESLLHGHPHIRRTLVWNKKQGKYRSLWALLKNVRQERYDWVINCQRFMASGWLTAFSGAKHTVGFLKNPMSLFFSHRVPHRIGTANHPVHEVERNLALIRHLTDDSFQAPKLYPGADARELAGGYLAGVDRYVCIAPTSVWYTKQYPAHKWGELIARIPADCTVFLLGGPDDAEACEHICSLSAHPGIRNAAGKLNFLASAALMQNAVWNYVNDSAPLHFASAVNARVAAVFCSTVPYFGFTPLSDQHVVIETSAILTCRPCGLHGQKACPEGHFKCAETINGDVFPVPEKKI